MQEKQHTRHLVLVCLWQHFCSIPNTGVVYCLFAQRFSRTSKRINELTPHFLFFNAPKDSGAEFDVMKSDDWKAECEMLFPAFTLLLTCIGCGWLLSQLVPMQNVLWAILPIVIVVCVAV